MKNITLNVDKDDFFSVLICAERYCLGRQTYMPSIVINFIVPLIPQLDDRALNVLHDDIVRAGEMGFGYGDETIDKPLWMKFLTMLKEEIAIRENKR